MATSFFDPKAPSVVLKSLFLKYDKDGSGNLNMGELRVLLMDDLGLTEEQADSYSYLLDKDGDASISFDEFHAWLNSGEKFKNVNDKSRYFRMKKGVDMFKKYDVDNSNALDRPEAEKLFRACGTKEEKIDDAMKELDTDGNGKISFPEFMKWLNWIPLDDL